MRVVHVTESDGGAGAARGVAGLHRALCKLGVDSQLLVVRRQGSATDVHEAGSGIARAVNRSVQFLDRLLVLAATGGTRDRFSLNLTGSLLPTAIRGLDPDIVNLHWVAGGLLRPAQLRTLPRPLVWTLRDMWPFTGGCHYDHGCGRHRVGCGSCPLIRFRYRRDITRRTVERKILAWNDQSFHVVGISSWLANQARSSLLFAGRDVRTIPLGIDVETFRPISRAHARARFGLPASGTILGFVALRPFEVRRKGWPELRAGLEHLGESDLPGPRVLVVVGEGTERAPARVGAFDVLAAGAIQDDHELAQLYSALDCLIAPSVQEGFGKIAIEAMACGTPVVAFRGTGLADAIDHQVDGYLAAHRSTEDLAIGLSWTFRTFRDSPARRKRIRNRAVQQHSTHREAEDYVAMYEELLAADG